MRRKRWMIAGAAVALVILVVLAIVTIERHVRHVGWQLMSSIPANPQAPVAIVLGAQVYKNGGLSAALEDRLFVAVQLYKNQSVEKLLMSGDSKRPVKYDETGVMRRYAVEAGVPEEDILIDPLGLRTYDSMARASSQFGVTRAFIVTQRFHMPRSMYLAKKMGIDPMAAVADRRVYRSKYVMGWREYMARVVAWFDVVMS